MTDAFPSLTVRADDVQAHGAFAENQARFLRPDARLVAALEQALAGSRSGVVAHYYMDAEIQGVLSACDWPHISVSDSLVMADRAVAMAQAGMKRVFVLGVDFMAETVRAMLDASGFATVEVYRLSDEAIGCSLAEAAEAPAYAAFLREEAKKTPALHVIYINTSLRTKAGAQALLPTVTCTSSNVVPLILQAFAQRPGLHVSFGPDSYMGANLQALLTRLAQLPPEELSQRFPGHSPASMRRARADFSPFADGYCIVHHQFGAEVVETLRRDYADALLTAHLEVPSEMFGEALRAEEQGRGVVGSTSDILRFIDERAQALAARGSEGVGAERIVLGTEAGMLTAIVNRVQQALRDRRPSDPSAGIELVFPVAAEAVSAAPAALAELAVVPGVHGGEGCSVGGGCATCPYMKQNTLATLLRLAEECAAERATGHAEYAASRPAAPDSAAELTQQALAPVIAMQHFQRTQRLPASVFC